MSPLDRSRLATVPWERLHQARSWTQATIWGLVWDGEHLVIKDFADRPWPLRATLGRWTIRREARAYERLAGLEGIPRFHGVIDGPALVLEWFPVARMPRGQSGLGPEFFDALDALLAGMHRRGVAHGDLRRKNIAIGGDGMPRLLDFTTAVLRPRWAWDPRRVLFHHLVRVDRLKALRMRLEFQPDAPLSEEQRALLASEPRLLRLGRWLRQRVYRPFKKQVLRR